MNAILIPNTPTIYCMFCRHNFKKECFDRSYQTLFKSWNLSISSPKPKKWHNWNLFLFCHLKMFCWTWRSGCTALKKRPPFLPAEHSTPSETSTQSMNESYLWFYTLKVFTALLAFHSDSFRSHVWLKVKETTKHKTFPGMGGGGGGLFQRWRCLKRIWLSSYSCLELQTQASLTASLSARCWIASQYNSRWFALASPKGRCIQSTPPKSQLRKFCFLLQSHHRKQRYVLEFKHCLWKQESSCGPGELVRLVLQFRHPHSTPAVLCVFMVTAASHSKRLLVMTNFRVYLAYCCVCCKSWIQAADRLLINALNAIVRWWCGGHLCHLVAITFLALKKKLTEAFMFAVVALSIAVWVFSGWCDFVSKSQKMRFRFKSDSAGERERAGLFALDPFWLSIHGFGSFQPFWRGCRL